MDYALQPCEFAYSNVRSSIAGAMNTLRRKERDASLFHLAGQFPSRVVREWRGEPPVAELLLLPVSILDETTKVGASGILLDFMVLHGLLTWDEDRGIYEPGLDWEEKWLFVVGDGLSIDRLFQFFDDLMAISDAKTSTFRAAYKQAMAITHVLHRVVPINGDLHVRFHMLDSIFRLFYGGFLQCVQHRLKWKRIDGNDVAQTYRQAHRLAVIVFEELDRLMIDAFLIRCFTQDRVDSFIDRGREEALATTIAKEYIQFLSRQVRESKDWLTVFSCNFLLIMRKYLMFHEAEQQGDSITMESMVIEFLPVFYIAKKSNSFNTQLRIIELYYQRLPNYVLHQIRVNRTKRQKRGSTPSWNTKESALDQIMERIMPFFKAMNHNGTEASFVKVSRMLTACQRAKHFVEFYTRNRMDGEYELAERLKEQRNETDEKQVLQTTDPGQRKKKTTNPMSRLNRVLVTELLTLAKCHDVGCHEDTAVDKNHFWKAMDATSLQIQKKYAALVMVKYRTMLQTNM